MNKIENYRLTNHARFQMKRRGITEDQVAKVLAAPEQVEVIRSGRVMYHTRFKRNENEAVYLLRVVVDVDRDPAEVVTAYWTSKVEKYWRK